MDGLDGHAARPPLGGDETRDRIADEFARIMGHSVAAPDTVVPDMPHMRASEREINVATYLLNPPASPERVEQRARRQRIVGIASISVCVLLAIVLVVPVPHWAGGSAPTAVVASASNASTSGSTSLVPVTPPAMTAQRAVPTLPRRVDIPGRHVIARRLDTPRPVREARRPSAPRTRIMTPVHRSPPPQPATSMAAPAMLVPLS